MVNTLENSSPDGRKLERKCEKTYLIVFSYITYILYYRMLDYGTLDDK